MDYHNFLKEINWKRSDMVDGFYAIPTSFCNFDPKTGDPIFEYEGRPEAPERHEFETDDEFNDASAEYAVDLAEWQASDPDEVVPDGFVLIDEYDEDDSYRVLALRMHLDEWDGDIMVHSRSKTLDMGSRSWLVVTDSEADDLWEQQLRSYIDDCLDIPDNVRSYFDEDKWIADAKIDGRGHTLSGYDGDEHEEYTNEGTFYIFRQH